MSSLVEFKIALFGKVTTPKETLYFSCGKFFQAPGRIYHNFSFDFGCYCVSLVMDINWGFV